MTCLDCTASSDAFPLIEQISHTRSVLGVGINDCPTSSWINGKPTKVYVLWRNMLARCYSANSLKRQASYIGCYVAEDWHLLSNFTQWFKANYIEGWHLDKDILIAGNRVYGPETCVFVPRALNQLLTDGGAARGDYPLGVTFDKASQKYRAQVRILTVNHYLGSFTTPLEAHRVYQLAKATAIESAETRDPRVRSAFDLRAAKLRDDHAHNRITTKL